MLTNPIFRIVAQRHWNALMFKPHCPLLQMVPFSSDKGITRCQSIQQTVLTDPIQAFVRLEEQCEQTS